MTDRTPRKPSRRRTRRAAPEALPPSCDISEIPAGVDVGRLLDMLGDTWAEEDEPITIRRRGRPSKKHKALADADKLAGLADICDPRQARDVAIQALDISPDCALAHVVLAELCEDVHEAEREHRLGIAAGERALGAAVIEQHMGELGRVTEAQGFLQARHGLANCLAITGRLAEATAECETLAALDAADRLMVRFLHLELLIEQKRFGPARQLCETWCEDPVCHWPYGRALIAFAEEGDTPEARRLLGEALAANRHVPSILLAGGEIEPSGLAFPGGEDEAELYVVDFRTCWMNTPGALAWLRAVGKVPVERPDTRRRAGGASGPGQRQEPEPAGGSRSSWTQEKRLLLQLPLDPTDAWEADVSEFDDDTWHVQVVSARDCRPLAIAVLEEPPEADELWAALVGAMRRPSSGDPRRPATLVMRPGVFPKTWHTKLEQIGIRQVVQDELATIEQFSREVDDRMAAVEAAREADAADPVAATAAILDACGGLPRDHGDTWQADVRRAPAWVTGEGEPYLPWLAVVVSESGRSMLNGDITRERPDAAAIVRLVGRTMLKAGVRPERVDVTTADLAHALGKAFAAIEIEVRQAASLPVTERLVTSLAEATAPPEAVAPLSAVPGVTPEIGQAFYEAAAAFHRAQPWRRAPSDAAIVVHVPGDEEGDERRVSAIVMGQSGMVQGLAVYEDEAALAAARTEGGKKAARSTGLSVMFGEGFEIPAVDYDWIERHGFVVAGPEAWPMPVRLNPGMNLRPPLVWELRLLTGCLRDVAAFVASVPAGRRGRAKSGSPAEWTSPAGWRLAWER